LFSGFTVCGGRKLQYKTGVVLFILEKETSCIKSVFTPLYWKHEIDLNNQSRFSSAQCII
jgi:hypothetical protein